LGDQYDAFKTHSTNSQIPDVIARVDDQRSRRRLDDLQVVERAFARGRLADLERQRTLHVATMDRARQMMSSEQLKAFDVSSVPRSELEPYGDTDFGRACRAASS